MKFDRRALAGLRILAGLSQADLALSVGLSRPYINQIESGVRDPSPHALAALARGLGVEISALVAHEVSCPNCGATFTPS